MVKIATWNVNSVRTRIQHLLDFLRADSAPDIVLLQELKCTNEAFPGMEIEDAGYNIAVHGQKTYNGVAILSKLPIEDVIRNIPANDDLSTDEARYIECVVSTDKTAIRVASVYVPNGQDPTSEKFQYKLKFLEKLREHMEKTLEYNELFVVGGDYNVAPSDIDVFDAKFLNGTTCFHPEERKRFRAILNSGFSDAYRTTHPHEQHFSWWDYRAGAWQQNKGMRIDHMLLSPQAADRLSHSGIDTEPRGKDKPSDHTPVWCTIK